MMNKAINILVLAMVDSLKKFKSKLAYYVAIIAMVFGSTYNAANAVDLTADDIWGDASSLTNGSTITDPASDIDVDLDGFVLTYSDIQGMAKRTGAITDGANNGAGDIAVLANLTTDYVTIFESAIITGNMTMTQSATNKASVTLTIEHAVANVIGGNLTMTNIDKTVNHGILLDINLGTLTVSGATSLVADHGGNGADVNLAVDLAATFTGGVTLNDSLDGLSTFHANEDNDVDITGTFNGAVAGEGTIIAAGTNKDFKSAIGATAKLLEVQVDGAGAVFDSTVAATTVDVNAGTTFTGAVTATTTTINGATAFSSTLTTGTVVINQAVTAASTIDATTLTLGGTSDALTASGSITSAIVVTDAASSLILAGADITVTGDINAAGTTDAGVIDVTGAKVTFAGNIGAATGTNVDTLTIAANKRAVITETANFVDQFDMAALGEIEISKTVVGGTIFTMTGTTFVAADIAATSKIYMPVNLIGGENIIFASGHTNVAGTATAIDSALIDTALTDYSAAQASGVTTVTATTKATSTIAEELSVSKNAAAAMVQALASVVNDTVVDGTAEDIFYNALTANGGLATTDVTDMALQIAPQTETIGGSSVATKAMTGTVQGIVSNRMASLRSGDAFVTGMSAGNGMSANSGFIQAFGSEGEQKNSITSGATTYGYDSETSGLAIGFDGLTETGETIGLSASFSTTDVDGKGTGKSKNSIDSYTVSVYADKATEIGYVEGSLTYGINDNTSSRLVNTAGLDRSYKGSYDSEQVSLKVGGGIPNEVRDGTFVTPFASGTATRITTDAYTETSSTNDDALRLNIAQDDISSLVGTVGVKAHMITDKGTPMISLSVNNEFGDNTISSQNTYTGGGTAFKTSTDVEELSATLGLGYSFGNDAASLNLNYEANANDDDYLSHYGTVKIIAKF